VTSNCLMLMMYNVSIMKTAAYISNNIFPLLDFDIKSNWLSIENKTTVQTSTAIQCGYICYKTKECETANFENDKHLCVM
jgi:hypothetical protein